MSSLTLAIQKRSFVRLLFLTVLSTVLVCALIQAIDWNTGHWRLFGLSRLFDLDREESFPTWLSSFLLFMAFVCASSIAKHPSAEVQRPRTRWWLLSVIFLLMSIDEVAGMHEFLGAAIMRHFHMGGYFYFGFVVPGTLAALAVFLIFIRMLLYLPRTIALGMLVSGGAYVIGTLGVEAIASNWAWAHGMEDPVYSFLVIIEESLEMFSIVYMIHTLLTYLEGLSDAKSHSDHR